MPISKKKYPTIYMVLSMAASRSDWIDEVRNFLVGGFREYAKQRLSTYVGYKGHDWTKEIGNLLSGVLYNMDEVNKKTKTKFDRGKAFREAYQDALSSGQTKVVEAKNILAVRHKITNAQYDKMQRTIFQAKELFPDMITEFLPGLVEFIDKTP